jgi:hypothetical protein
VEGLTSSGESRATGDNEPLTSEVEPRTSQAGEKKSQTPMFKRQKSPIHQLQLGTGTRFVVIWSFFGVWDLGVWSFFADSENLT